MILFHVGESKRVFFLESQVISSTIVTSSVQLFFGRFTYSV